MEGIRIKPGDAPEVRTRRSGQEWTGDKICKLLSLHPLREKVCVCMYDAGGGKKSWLRMNLLDKSGSGDAVRDEPTWLQ
jgi:hypothetical protein